MSTASLDKLIKQRKQLHDEESTKAIFDKERECLELLLDARKLLAYLVKMREIKNQKEKEEKERAKQEEAKKKGNLNVTEIQGILQQAPEQEDTDWLTGNIKLLSIFVFSII